MMYLQPLRSEAGKDHIHRFGSSKRLWFGQQLLAWAICLLWGAMFWVGTARAQSTNYVYDANGRVVAVTASNGTSVQYSYDSLGHANQISAPLSSGQLAIFAFTPTHGVTGTEVTLQGQGFSSSATNDTVSFNGTVASVLSASATQLTVNVPSGATTGLLSVTAAGQTATSTTPFAIDDTGVPPSITQVTPVVVAVGSTVTVTGTHFDPVAGDTAAQLGNLDTLPVSSLTDSQLQFTVPGNAASGYVTIDTPYGTATSATPVVLLPSSIVSEASGVTPSNVSTNGSALSFSTGVAGQIGILTFTANAGDNLELELTNLNVTGGSQNQVEVQVFNPVGTVIETLNCTGSATTMTYCHQPLWNLAAGTYSIVVTPTYGGTITFNALLQPDVIGPALTANTPLNVDMSVGQMERVTFNATAGQTVALSLANVNTGTTGQAMYALVYAPGAVVWGSYYTFTDTTGSTTLNLPNLPASGTYTVVLGTGNSVPGSVQVTLASGVTGTVPSDGTNESYATAVSNQNAYLSFTANAGDNLELELTNVNVTGGSQNEVNVQVFNAAGSSIESFTCTGSASTTAYCHQPLWSLAAGTYSIIVSPVAGGTISFNALLQPDIIGPTLTVNTPLDISMSVGQMERVTFNATAGQTLALSLSNLTTIDGQIVAAIVYAPNSGAITQSNYYAYLNSGNSNILNLPNLPVSGTYTVVIGSGNSVPMSGQITLVPGAASTVTGDAASESYSTSVSGQNAYLSFTANAGDNLELELVGVNVTGGSQNQVNVQVANANGTVITSFSCPGSAATNYCHQPLWNMAAGAYVITMSPANGGTMSFNALLQPDVIGPALTANTPLNVNLTAGQMERVTFTATAGQTVALSLSGVSTTPSGQFLAVFVYLPGASNIVMGNQYALMESASSGTLNLPDLPATGAYTLIIGSGYSVPVTGQLTLVPQ